MSVDPGARNMIARPVRLPVDESYYRPTVTRISRVTALRLLCSSCCALGHMRCLRKRKDNLAGCSTISQLVRRILAISMLFVLGVALGLPFVQAQETTPACCRRDGKHHCMGSMGADGFKSAAMACPYRYLRVLTTRTTALVAVRAGVTRSGLQDTIQSPELSQIAIRVPEKCHDRGPPPFQA